MKLHIITVGSKPQQTIDAIISRYTDRMPRNITVSWTYIAHGDGDHSKSMQQEAEKILKAIGTERTVILLDEMGKNYSSPELSEIIFSDMTDCAFIIGGAYGVTDAVRTRSSHVWSLSRAVFPHQLVRIILAEQLYRCHTIAVGHPYHHA